MENQLAVIVKESGLEPAKGKFILEQFQGYFKLADEWEAKAKAIVVTDETQILDMKMARTGRLFLREKRIAVEKTRKELKEQALREGKAIDGIANVLKALIVPIEKYLESQEKFVELQAERKAALRRLEVEKRIAEEDRIAQEKEAAEQEGMRLDNERLRKEAEEREESIQAEREAAELQAKAAREKANAEKRVIEERVRKAREKAGVEKRAIQERARKAKEKAARLAEAERREIEENARVEREKLEAEREKAEAELQKKKDAEEKLRREEEKKAEAFKRASDKKKLANLLEEIKAIKLPAVKSKKSGIVIARVGERLLDVERILKASIQ